MPRPKRTVSPRTADLLFEIGTEELPAAYLPSLIEQLEKETGALLNANHLTFRSIKSFGTPRRLVLIVRGLTSAQHKPGEDVRGPSKQAAYDNGKPTPALLGFLRSQGGALQRTKLISTPKGEYVYLAKPPTTTPTVKVLPALLPQLIGRLRSPKMMRWDASGVRFARPIRWLLARYGSTPIRFTFGALESGSKTKIGRPQQLRWINVTSLGDYLRTLKSTKILLDHHARRARIKQEVTQRAARFHGEMALEMVSYGLLDEVSYLVEQPFGLTGEFDRQYLDLPREVLLASMAKHQRVFAIDSSLTPSIANKEEFDIGEGPILLRRFVAILEGKPGRPKKVQQVIERILNARLADSLLFWKSDRERLPLDQMVQDLVNVTFHEKLGSMADKSNRLYELSTVLKEAWNLSEAEFKNLRRACRLAKADLVSTMVKEFPTLQGVMGKYYAQGHEYPTVAQAIEEHYLPIGERLPETLSIIGGALAILDKYDTLASYFSIGILPTGDQDPFGLRRAAQGIVEVGWKIHRPLPLEQLFRIRASLGAFGVAASGDSAKQFEVVRQKIQTYLLERLYTFAWPAPAPSVDCIDAVLASPCEDLVDAMDRVVSLQKLSGHPGLLKAAKVIERTRNILRGSPRTDGDVEPGLLKEPQEHALWDVYRQHKDRMSQLITDRRYDKATMEFGELFFEPLHLFFDKVLVNDPDEALQRNRLALMRVIHTLYTERVADLSKLTILQQQQHEEHL